MDICLQCVCVCVCVCVGFGGVAAAALGISYQIEQQKGSRGGGGEGGEGGEKKLFPRKLSSFFSASGPVEQVDEV